MYIAYLSKRLAKWVTTITTTTTNGRQQKPVPRAAAAYGRQLKIKNMSIFLASWMYLMVIIDGSSFLTASNALAVLRITSMGPFNRVFKMPIKSKKLIKFHDVDEIP